MILVLPLASSEAGTDPDEYLNCLTDKKIDIVFVFDTTNSMGGEINELRATANKFATDLEAYQIDYTLGLVEFRDFPITCGEGKKIQCGSPGDFAYNVKGNGTLTSEISTFGVWLDELKAGGGGSGGPEAVLAALRHAGTDVLWRDDAEKEIILLTDAGPHPDGSCCNAEGDTLNGTIFGLTHLGARVNVIGPDEASLEKIAKDTGGQFFKIRSGLSLKPLLEKITEAMSYSFNVTIDATCNNGTLESTVQLVGIEAIPYISGKTEAWMYLDQSGSKSRYNMSYDQTSGAYKESIPEACGDLNITVYGRVGESSTAQTMRVNCGTCKETADELISNSNQPPEISSFEVTPTSPQEAGTAMTFSANGTDIDGDTLLYRFFVDDNPVSDWIPEKTFVWTPDKTGTHRIEVRVKDSNHAGPNGLDDRKVENFIINEPIPTKSENRPPVIDSLLPEQSKATEIIWTANATDSDSDKILYKYYLNNKTMTDWIDTNKWILNASNADVGENQVEVQVRDGKHEGPEGYDDAKSVQFNLSSMKLMTQKWKKELAGSGASVKQTKDGGYIVAGGGGGGWLIKIDLHGNTLWDANYGGGQCEHVEQTNDGGYIVAGINVSSPDGKDADMWLIKTDENGSLIWDRTFGESQTEYGQFVQQTNDGGYFIAGECTSYSGDFDAWAIKTDSEGNPEWDKTYGKTVAKSSLQTYDGGYVIIGYSVFSHSWITKSNLNGEVQWDRELSGDSVQSGTKTKDNGYILAGGWGSDGWLTKIEENGIEKWHKTLSGTDANFAEQTKDGGYIVAGGEYPSYAWLIKTDANGNEEWKRILDCHRAESVAQTKDGGYIVAAEGWLIKTDANGNV